jgi:hypothetical protein
MVFFASVFITEVHPSLNDSTSVQSKSISNDTLSRLAKTVLALEEEKKVPHFEFLWCIFFSISASYFLGFWTVFVCFVALNFCLFVCIFQKIDVTFACISSSQLQELEMLNNFLFSS